MPMDCCSLAAQRRRSLCLWSDSSLFLQNDVLHASTVCLFVGCASLTPLPGVFETPSVLSSSPPTRIFLDLALYGLRLFSPRQSEAQMRYLDSCVGDLPAAGTTSNSVSSCPIRAVCPPPAFILLGLFSSFVKSVSRSCRADPLHEKIGFAFLFSTP